MPLIEASELSIRFDRHVVSLALQAAAELVACEDGPLVTVNLPPASLRSAALVGSVQTLLREHPLAAGRLVLELTEQGLADDPDRLAPSLLALKELGCQLAIDDFGTGASSLVRLRALPFDLVKIDQSFVRGVPAERVDTAIVKSTIELAHNLGMKTVAEGVETAATADAVTRLGCDKLQGWLFARAMPLDDLVDRYGLIGTGRASGLAASGGHD